MFFLCIVLFFFSFFFFFFFYSSRRRHTRSLCDWSSDVCSSDLRSLSGVVPMLAAIAVAALSRGATKKSICGRRWRSSCTRNTTVVGRPSTRSAARASSDACFDSFHRSEEHTSELQSHSDLVCRLLLEKKKIRKHSY